MPRKSISFDSDVAFTYPGHFRTEQERLEAFKVRQQVDLDSMQSSVSRRRRFHKRYIEGGNKGTYDRTPTDSGEEGWRTSEGDRLEDFGVDEEAEFYDEDDIPLALLLERKKS